MNWKNIINELSLSGLTQQEIADFCGCTQSAISDLHTGKSKEPKASLAYKLMDLSKNKHSELAGG